jgi:hypothetical protein
MSGSSCNPIRSPLTLTIRNAPAGMTARNKHALLPRQRPDNGIAAPDGQVAGLRRLDRRRVVPLVHGEVVGCKRTHLRDDGSDRSGVDLDVGGGAREGSRIGRPTGVGGAVWSILF